MAKKPPSISIFFPFLNDWGTVGSLVALTVSTVTTLTDDWEIIIVNDGSKKEDREGLGEVVNVILNSFQDSNKTLKPALPARFAESRRAGRQVQGDKRIRIIDHEKNRGYGGALRSGFGSATKDLIFYTDCDAQYDPRELKKMYEVMMEKPAYGSQATAGEVGMVNGYKIKRNDPWFRIVAGRVYHHIVKIAFGLPIRDTDCDFRLIRREVFDPSTSSGRTAVRLFENTGTICVELVKKIDHAGFGIAEVPVHHYWRTSGKSQFFNFGRLYKTVVNLGKLWWKLMVNREYEK